MATEIAPTNVNGPYFPEGDTPQLTQLSSVPSDPTNGNVVNMGNSDVMVVFFNMGVAAQTVSINSSNDPYNRTADIVDFDLPAGESHARIFRALGWEQSTGAANLIFSTSSVDIEVVAIPL